MPRHPHVGNKPDPTRPLESFFASHPVLRDFAERGRLVWYDLQNKTCPTHDTAAPLQVRFFSSEAVLQLIARLGGKTVRTLGIDGGRSYSGAFQDLNRNTLLANGQPSFDLQFREIASIVREHRLDCTSLIPPMRIAAGRNALGVGATRNRTAATRDRGDAFVVDLAGRAHGHPAARSVRQGTA